VSFQQSQGFSYWRSADIQLCRNLTFDESITRLNHAFADGLADLSIDAVNKRKALLLRRKAARPWRP